MEKWYVARSKPQNEELLWKQYCLRNVETYYPCIKVQPVNPRARKVQPYFPGYLFIRVDLSLTSRSMLEWVPGGNGLVSFGGEPASLPDSLIQAIKQRLEDMKPVNGVNPIMFCKGDHVVIRDGLFKGYEAIFDVQLSGADRVRVLLSLLNNQQIPVELSVGCIHLANQI